MAPPPAAASISTTGTDTAPTAVYVLRISAAIAAGVGRLSPCISVLVAFGVCKSTFIFVPSGAVCISVVWSESGGMGASLFATFFCSFRIVAYSVAFFVAFKLLRFSVVFELSFFRKYFHGRPACHPCRVLAIQGKLEDKRR